MGIALRIVLGCVAGLTVALFATPAHAEVPDHEVTKVVASVDAEDMHW